MTEGTYLAGPALSRRQMTIIGVFGLTLWLAAALLLRAIGPMGVYDGTARVILYLAIIPGTYPALLLLRRLAGLADGQMVHAMAFGTAVAILMDGIALAWFPDLYGAGVDLHAGAGGTILWGGGVGLALAFWVDRRRR